MPIGLGLAPAAMFSKSEVCKKKKKVSVSYQANGDNLPAFVDDTKDVFMLEENCTRKQQSINSDI